MRSYLGPVANEFRGLIRRDKPTEWRGSAHKETLSYRESLGGADVYQLEVELRRIDHEVKETVPIRLCHIYLRRTAIVPLGKGPLQG